MKFGLGNLTRALKGGGLIHQAETIHTGGMSTGIRIMDEKARIEREKKAKAARDLAAADVASKKAKAAGVLEKRRMLLGRQGARSTRRSGATPDLFSGSAGQIKTLLG